MIDPNDWETQLAAENHERLWKSGIRITIDWSQPLEALRPVYKDAARIIAQDTQELARPSAFWAAVGAVLGRDPLGD